MQQCPSCDTELEAAQRFCPQCGAPLDDGALSEARTILSGWAPGAMSPPPASPPPSGAWPSSTSLDSGVFTAGSTLAGRYRIVGLLGRGGMGEVYRADDLMLGQPVALKFLPRELAANAERLARFYGEVRISRTVSHPNVCRVYDIGETEGQPYLSMEYVDGDDLASLLRRIGRLPKDKGLDVARQLCAGLAAAHDKGVLHRDLKPANIMIDGRGKVRITDFGLAVLADEAQNERRAGTPAYMAPEQLTHNDVSVQSDIYSLGVVLYEMFTGRVAFSGTSIVEFTRLHLESTPAPPSSIIDELDQTIERPILRCLEKNARDRPASALAVAMSLPGGDPLAAALAAGETPSPEMVAAAGGRGTLRVRVAGAVLAASFAMLAGAVWMSDRLSLVNRVPLPKASQVLVDRAGELLRQVGHDAAAADRGFGFQSYGDYVRWVRENDSSSTRWDGLASGRPPAIRFWYRQSPRFMMQTNLLDGVGVTLSDPPAHVSGMATVLLDPAGRLLQIQIVPPQVDSLPVEVAPPDWEQLFHEAGLDLARFEATRPVWVPPDYCDTRLAWIGEDPGRTDAPARVEAGLYAGKLSYFQIVGPWTRANRMEQRTQRTVERIGQIVNVAILMILLVAGAMLARRNLTSGRSDRRGAFRVALYIFALHMLVWLLVENHAPSAGEEWQLLFSFLGLALFVSGMVWVWYLALEPYVRHRWPDSLISWSRLIAGQYRDPLVGRDLLFGGAAGLGIVLARCLTRVVPVWLGQPPPPPLESSLEALNGPLWTFVGMLVVQPGAIINAMAMLFLLSLFRRLLRRDWLTLAVLVPLIALLFGASSSGFWIGFLYGLMVMGVWMGLLLRYGLFALVSCVLVVELVDAATITSDMSRWYAASGLFILGVVLLCAIYGFRTATSGRSLLRPLTPS